MSLFSNPLPVDDMRTVFRLTQFEMRYPEFVKREATKLVNESLLPEIHRRMKNFGYSDKIINTTRLDKVDVTNQGEIVFDIISDYKSDDGFDVATAREKGTIDHFVKNTIRKALSFIIQNTRAFSKGHWVRGIRASNVIEKTIEELTPAIQLQLNEATDEFFKRSISQ